MRLVLQQIARLRQMSQDIARAWTEAVDFKIEIKG